MSYGQAVVSVEPAEVESPAVGEELMVSINITGGADVAGYQITVNFDPTALEYVSGANADYLPAGAFGVPPTTTESSVTIAGTSLTGAAPDADGTLATVTFTVVESKPSAISLTGVTLADATAAALEVTTMDGMVTVDGAGPAAEEEVTEEPAAEEEAEEEVTEEPAAEEEAEEEVTEEPAAEEEVAPEMPVSQMFEITLTNLTTGEHGVSGQTLSPAIFAAHPAGVKLAEVGQPASPAIVALAEGGDTSGLEALAAAAGANVKIAMNVDMTRRYTMPGQSTTVTVTADKTNSSLSIGSMLVSTNDAFIAVIDEPLFDEDGMPVTTTIDLMAYDAGSEDNTEMASDIPGPLGLDEATDPPGSNERVPTVDGVIAAHEGIQGVGDVTEAFAWEEPTAMLTITPVEMPTEPVVEEPMPEPVVEGPGFDVTLEAGLNMISIPLMPAEPYTAKSLAEMLGATVVIQLDAATQGFVGYTVADEGDGFGIDGGMGYIVNTPAGANVKFTGDAWDNQPEQPEPEEAPAEEPVAEEDAPAEEPAAAEEEVAEEPAAEEPAAAEEE
ncbi:spondin domain-containing protein, partial [Candidatus Poribacteria bacterium]|nr:spondin domain-containing protein [Candidatus Poribacteria bacterium]